MKKEPNIRTKIPVKGMNYVMIKREIFSYFQNEPDVLTVAQITKLLHCSKNTVYELLHAGRLPSVAVGRRLLVPKAALVEFLANEKNYTVLLPKFSEKGWTSGKTCGMVGVAKKRNRKGA